MMINATPEFQGFGIIDVTNFTVTRADESMGYLCGGTVSVFSDGKIQIVDAYDEGTVLDSLHVHDLFRMNSNINNYDPSYSNDVSLLTEDKSIRITFNDVETKKRFVEVLKNLSAQPQ